MRYVYKVLEQTPGLSFITIGNLNVSMNSCHC